MLYSFEKLHNKVIKIHTIQAETDHPDEPGDGKEQYMGKKMAKAGLFSLAALGAGAAVFMAGKKEKGCAKKCTAPKEKKQTDYSDYRNTERDKQKKNSKGIYYSKGNYEAFAVR